MCVFSFLSHSIWSFFPRTPLLRMSNDSEYECVCVVLLLPLLIRFCCFPTKWNALLTWSPSTSLFYSKSYSYYNPYTRDIFLFCFLFFRILGKQCTDTIHTKCLGLSISVFTFKYPIKFVLCQIKDALDASSSSSSSSSLHSIKKIEIILFSLEYYEF